MCSFKHSTILKCHLTHLYSDKQKGGSDDQFKGLHYTPVYSLSVTWHDILMVSIMARIYHVVTY